MRKRSEQVYSRESSATLQLTVSLLYPIKLLFLAFPTFFSYNYFNTDMCTDLIGRGREFYGKYAKYAKKKRR